MIAKGAASITERHLLARQQCFIPTSIDNFSTGLLFEPGKLSSNSHIVCIDCHSVPINSRILEDTSEEPNFQNCTINTQKFNKSIISIYGLVFLIGMVILILVPSWISHDPKNVEKQENIYKLFYMLLCSLPVVLPTIYFILHPNHFVIAVENLPFKCICKIS